MAASPLPLPVRLIERRTGLLACLLGHWRSLVSHLGPASWRGTRKVCRWTAARSSSLVPPLTRPPADLTLHWRMALPWPATPTRSAWRFIELAELVQSSTARGGRQVDRGRDTLAAGRPQPDHLRGPLRGRRSRMDAALAVAPKSPRSGAQEGQEMPPRGGGGVSAAYPRPPPGPATAFLPSYVTCKEKTKGGIVLHWGPLGRAVSG